MSPNKLNYNAPWGDCWLQPFSGHIEWRMQHADHTQSRLTGDKGSLTDFASGHEYFGLHLRNEKWRLAEWAPNATAIHLIGDFNNWERSNDFAMQRCNAAGTWELELPLQALRHGQHYKLYMEWPGGHGERIPAYARRVVQDNNTKMFTAQVWQPEEHYAWRNSFVRPDVFPLIYETHAGMAQEREGVGTYNEFREFTLPRIARAGYNTIQLMALMEHPYYGSFGYHVSNFFAASSRFGTPEELKALIDAAHGMGIAVIMDMVHSHAVKNENEGLGRFDGTRYQYFHDGPRGEHPAWDSLCFNYAKPEVLHFLLSNCRFWLDEYRIDGFRFDGITSMLYTHHGLGPGFNSYEDYFNHNVDEDALAYLTLANRVIHSLRPDAMTIAEDVSGMPGLAAPLEAGGCGFDYRLAMGIPDLWFKLANDVRDEDWSMQKIWHELNNRRVEEQTVSYVESHDQALVGGKSMIFELIDAAMYDAMRKDDRNLQVARGIALHKMMRLVTVGAAAHAYLNFMGNEFGHPEWIDFPREGNNWSYHYARRLWSLLDNNELLYHCLADFDRAMTALVNRGKWQETSPKLLKVDNADKVLAFERAGFFFFFNFHPDKSYTDYAQEVLPGCYKLALDCDSPEFGGHGRIEPEQLYHTIPHVESNTLKHCAHLYLPSRSAVVLERQL